MPETMQHSAQNQNQPHKHALLRKLAALQKTLLQKSLAVDFEALQSFIIQQIPDLVPCQACALILVDQTNQDWIICESISARPIQTLPKPDPSADQGIPQRSFYASQNNTRSLIQETLRSQTTLNITDITADERFDAASDSIQGVQAQSMLCVPLVIGASKEKAGQSLGVIQAVNRWHAGAVIPFSPADQSVLEMVSGMAASAIHTLRLDRELKVARAEVQASNWELVSAQGAIRALFENLPDAIYLVDRQYQLIASNRQRRQRIPPHLGQDTENQVCYQAFFGRSTACPGCLVKETIDTAQPTVRTERRYANVPVHQSKDIQPSQEEANWDENAIEWEIHTIPVVDSDQHTIQVILLEKDVTEKRQLENILTQSEKLAALGQLAAGIAHEINNPLTAILANAQILHRSLPAGDDLQESVDLIARAGARAVQVVRNLLDFARKEEYHLSVTNLNENLQRALDLVKHELLARSINLEFDPDPDLPSVLVSQDHLQSVWLNLLLNAIDSVDKTPANICVSSRKTSRHITITVADNGKGIPLERLGRIFEPFYTTKAPGRGTGLGLSVSYRIIKQHGGSIQVESQVGKGSTFKVTLPLN